MAAWTQAELDALEHAIAQGALSVRFADRTVTYHSLTDLLKLREVMRRSLASPKRAQVGLGGGFGKGF